MSDQLTKIRFPQITKIAFEAFSLYAQKPDVSLEVAPGVVCLAGANGIGKSTFLAAVNFALTGAVPGSRRNFKSAAEYLAGAKTFAPLFFAGRIKELDRERAAISLEFTIGETTCAITRSLFDAPNIRSLTITEVTRSSTGPASSAEGQAESPVQHFEGATDREEAYSNYIVRQTMLRSFEQFVFLQHFIFTFDESRHLLFWDERALEQVLYLCFGANPAEAAQLEELRRSDDKFDSQGRNLRFQASNVAKRIRDLEAALKKAQPQQSDMVAIYQHEVLIENNVNATKARDDLESELRDAQVRRADVAAQIESLRAAYSETYAKKLGEHKAPRSHPVVHSLIAEHRCVACGTESDLIEKSATAALEGGHCPICDSAIIAREERPLELGELKVIDQKLAAARRQLKAATETASRLEESAKAANLRAVEAKNAVEQFERGNAQIIARSAAGDVSGKGLSQKITDLGAEYAKWVEMSHQAYAQRDDVRSHWKVLQRSIERGYAAAESDFVPKFRQLAHLFLGIDLDVRMQTRQPSGVTLVLDLESVARRHSHMLSESQKFFVDIALRMALAQFISDAAAPAGLFIDTPEGSLDIAYESRAGQMFARFAKANHSLLMTANINTSELLKELARNCGHERMQLVRMTAWANLSEVQVESSALFERAFDEIEKELSSDGAR